MIRLFTKKTKDIKDVEIKKWAEVLKEAETHFITCANYCRNVKRLLKDLDSSIIKKNIVKNFNIAGDIGIEWERVVGASGYILENSKIIFKDNYKNKDQLLDYVNGFFISKSK